MELRNRHPADTPVRRADRHQADTGPAHADVPRYDANAEFKHGVPRPPGHGRSIDLIARLTGERA